MPNDIKNSAIIFKADGIVLEGKKKGKELGFPTANIPGDDSISSGIYAGEVIWKGTAYPAAIYKGDAKDVVYGEHSRTIEAHLLDFSDNLYGETITIIAYQKVRDSKIFSNREELIAAIGKDIEDIKKCLQE